MGVVPLLEAHGTRFACNAGNAYGLYIRQSAINTASDLHLSDVRIEHSPQCFKRRDVATDNVRRAFEAVVVPAPPVANLEALIATLDAVPGVGLAVVSLLGYVYLGADAQ
ncbi:MAG: hypothetical protein VX464_02910 [Pseudomonadota bacterium]|nr:hypothetical protein [Pseudomonadota bacterium]